MKIAIFGSCVSRDACEFIPDSNVITYVARHSVTSLESAHGVERVDISGLDSPFQKRMVTRDLEGSGVDHILVHADELDLVLVDLVDERRGYWLFPDGTTMTNSLEAEICGAVRGARRRGARLVEFGTDEHFERWKTGFGKLIGGLASEDLLRRTILLDIEWAAAIDGSQHPKYDTLAQFGRGWRRLQRGAREAGRSLSKGQSLGAAAADLRHVRPTEAEEYADRAATANASYVRYRDVAGSKVPSTVVRTSSQLRINRSHKWGPQPFHFRDQDYQSIVQSVLEKVDIAADPHSGSE